MRDWTLRLSAFCPIAVELFSDRLRGKKGSASTTDGDLPDAVFRYANRRHRSSSVESKLAHLIKVDVIPSFAQYRTRELSTNTEMVPSLLDDSETGPLAGYA